MRSLALCVLLLWAAPAQAAPPAHPLHGLSPWGTLKYPAGFAHFDYVNPEAPKGGEVKFEATGSFDSLNPFIVKGNKAPGSASVFESLMVGALDEPQSVYALVAKSAVLSSDRRFIEFTLRPEARFHDGSPITADDVVFSFDTLKKDGDPTYRISYAPVARAVKTGPLRVRFEFSDTSKRELPLIAATMPILSKRYYATHEFAKTTLEPPMASGAYRIASVNPGRSIVYERVKDYWGEKLPVNVGQNNFSRMRYDLYRDETVSLEALKAGEYDFREENVARSWAMGYDCPALRDGRLKKVLVPHQVPQGMQGSVFNLRHAKFADRRVREAIALTLDFEWMNKTVFFGAYRRDTSYFVNTPYAVPDAPPDAKETALLAPYRAELPAELFTKPFQLPVTDGSGNNRKNLLRADRLLTDAGWVIRDGKRVNAATGRPLTVEFLLESPVYERVAMPMRRQLRRLGIDASVRLVDNAQYVKRIETFDFDILLVTVFNRSVFFPGNEQKLFWHSSQADQPGSENIAGVKNPVIDALIARITSARSEAELLPVAHALDRVLLWEHYVIPHWYLGAYRIAYWDKFGMPTVAPKYSLGIQTWWVDRKKSAALSTRK